MHAYYIHIHIHTVKSFQFMLVEEKSITSGKLCKTFDETLLSRTQKSHFPKHATNHKMVTSSGRACDILFGLHMSPDRPQDTYRLSISFIHLSLICI